MKHARKRSLASVKILVVIAIIIAVLPFYNGVNITGFENWASTYFRGKDADLKTDKEGQVNPPANMDYTDGDNGTESPVNVMPMPTTGSSQDENPEKAPVPETTPVPVITPTPGTSTSPEQPGDNMKPEPTDKPNNTENPEPTATPDPGSQPDDEEGNGVHTGSAKELQEKLDKIYRRKEYKVAYLTFDDGPTPALTSKILDILAEEDVKATFFVIGNLAERYPEMVKREYEEGHGIANHTYSHVFKHIYKKTDNFVNEIKKTERVLQSILGDDKKFRLIRFPGGSFGDALKPYRNAANKAGFAYVDWNSLNGDAETVESRSPEQLIARLKETVNGKSSIVVLMHDAPQKKTTVEALPDIIRYLKSEGYHFELLPGSR